MLRFLILSATILGLVILSCSVASAQQAARESPPLRLIQQIPLPGVQGRMDHFTVDAERERIIFSALGNNTVEVVSLFAGRLVSAITGAQEPQGVLYIAGKDRLVVANAGDGKVRIYDGTSLALLHTLDFGKDPDNIRYDAARQRIYVGYGEDEDGAIGVIDAATGQRIQGDYKLGGGHPESFQLETTGSKMFVNDPDGGNVVLAIDRQTHAVSRWQLHGNRFNFPMALDETHHRLFVGTRRPARLNVLNTDTGELVTAIPCAGDTDDIYYDAHTRRIYVIGGAGMISVIQQKDSDHYESLADIPSAIGARTGYYLPTHDTDRLYVAVPARADHGAELWVYEVQD